MLRKSCEGGVWVTPSGALPPVEFAHSIINVMQEQQMRNQLSGWWRRSLLRFKSFFKRDEVTSRIRKAERAVETNYLYRPEAEINHLQVQGAAALITALQGTAIARIEVGGMQLIKTTGPDGKSSVIVSTAVLDCAGEFEGIDALHGAATRNRLLISDSPRL